MAADILKGLVAVVIARLLTDEPWPAIAAAAAMAGHVFPVWLRFKGGKGVAVGGGAVLGLMPLAALILFAIWVVVVASPPGTRRWAPSSAPWSRRRWSGRSATRSRISSSRASPPPPCSCCTAATRGACSVARSPASTSGAAAAPAPSSQTPASPPTGPSESASGGGMFAVAAGGFVKLLTVLGGGWIFVAIDTISAGRVPQSRPASRTIARGGRVATESPPRPAQRVRRTIGPDAAWRRSALGDYLSEFFGVFVLIAFGTGVVATDVAGLPQSGRGDGITSDADWLLITHWDGEWRSPSPSMWPAASPAPTSTPRSPSRSRRSAASRGRRSGLHHRPDPGRDRRRRARLLGLPRRDQRVRGGRRPADRPRRRRGQHRDIRDRPRRVHRQLRRCVPQRGRSAPRSCSSSSSRSSTS